MHGLTTVQGSHVKENEASILSLSLSAMLARLRSHEEQKQRSQQISSPPLD
jgi:hypothetical protein